MNVGGRRVYNARVRNISVTNVLAVETSKRLVHRALIAQKPQALAATHPYAARAVAIMLFHNVVGTREAGRVMPQCVMPFAGASPPITGVAHRMEALPCVAISLRVEVGRNRSPRAAFGDLRKARAILSACETPPMGANCGDTYRVMYSHDTEGVESPRGT